MIRLELVADTPLDLIAQIHKLFPVSPSKAYPPDGGLKEPVRDFKDTTSLSDTVREHFGVTDAQLKAVAEEAIDLEEVKAAIEEVAPAAIPRRGRPRKNAQPAVAENTGSPAALTLPAPPPVVVVAEQASTSVATETALPTDKQEQPSSVATPSFTAEQVRAKLQEFLVTPGGDRGLQLAGDVLGQFGLAKVKQVNDNPQHFAGIVAAVDAELAKLAVAK